MKKFFIIFPIVLTLIGHVSFTGQAQAQEYEAFLDAKAEKTVIKKLEVEHEEDSAIIQFKAGVTDSQIEDLNDKLDTEIVDKDLLPDRFETFLDQNNVEIVKTENEEDLKETLINYEKENLVESVDVNVIGEEDAWTTISETTYPDDFDSTPSYADGDHWYYEKTNMPDVWYDQDCQSGGAGCGGSNSVVVAVLDTGLAYENYSDGTSTFSAAPEIDSIPLFQNSAEVSGSAGVDDDNNDYCDDEHGFDMGRFVYNWLSLGLPNTCSLTQVQHEGHPNDDNGHGTFVTSIISSEIDNGTNSVGMANNVSIMPIKVNEPRGNPNSLAWAFGVLYAIEMGADIITTSVVFTGDNLIIQDVVNEAVSDGITFVAASGNDNTTTYYPARYTNVVGVGASNKDDSRSDYSNYGTGLNVVAPVGEGGGAHVESMLQQTYACFVPDNCGSNPSDDFDDPADHIRANGVGTSFAAPQVAAALALMRSKYSNETGIYPGTILNATAQDIGAAGVDSETGYGLLDVDSAMNRHGFYQSIISTDNNIYNRWTKDLGRWTTWQRIGEARGNPNQINFSGDLWQAVRGTNNGIYTRKTNSDMQWESWQLTGSCGSDISMVEHGGELWQAVRGLDNGIYTRKYNAGWTFWTLSGSSASNIVMHSFDNKLWQAVRGTNNGIYTRYYESGVWSQWELSGTAASEIKMMNYGNKLWQAVRGTNNTIYTRSYDPIGDSWTLWSGNGSASSDITMLNADGFLWQSAIGVSSEIFMRTYDGASWSSWSQVGIATGNVDLAEYNGYIVQSVKGTDTGVYTRRYNESTDTWSGWSMGGSTQSNISSQGYTP